MQPTSARFLEAIRGPYRSRTVVDILWGGVTIVSDIPVEAGSITVDRTAAVRRQGQITLGDRGFIPQFALSSVAPYGAELRIRQGVAYPDGSDELVSLGVFRIQSAGWDESPGGSPLPVIDFFDRSRAIADAQFLTPIDRSGVMVKSLITDLITHAVSNATVTIDASLVDVALPGGTVFDIDRAAALTTCAQAMGAEWYADVNGNFQIVPVPVLDSTITAGDAVWTVDAGPSGVLVSANRSVSRDGVANAVVAMGTDAGDVAPPIGMAFNTNVTSPTYWGAVFDGTNTGTPFGQAVKRITNGLLLTTAQCQEAAAAELANSIGLAKSLSFASCPNPALDAGDIVKVVYPDATSELHLIDSLRIPLGVEGSLEATTRSQIGQLS